jgi:hypothetical protein
MPNGSFFFMRIHLEKMNLDPSIALKKLFSELINCCIYV